MLHDVGESGRGSLEQAASIKLRARQLGFASAGIADLKPNDHGEHLQRWLDEGLAGSMGYMHRQVSHRLSPATIVPGTCRAVVLTRNYFNPDPLARVGAGLIAKYARGPDYHDALRPALSRIAEHVMSVGGRNTVAKSFVDAGPVPERELGYRAGLGWIGKNTMLIEPGLGSFFFLAVLLTNLELPVDQPLATDRCGTCRRCIDACPTNAILEGRLIDSRRCVAYLTIEHKGEIRPKLGEAMGHRVFGCDVCQDVCPWNIKFASQADDAALFPKPANSLVDLASLAGITEKQFEESYARSALERPGLEGMKRNARIVLQNQQRLKWMEL